MAFSQGQKSNGSALLRSEAPASVSEASSPVMKEGQRLKPVKAEIKMNKKESSSGQSLNTGYEIWNVQKWNLTSKNAKIIDTFPQTLIL